MDDPVIIKRSRQTYFRGHLPAWLFLRIILLFCGMIAVLLLIGMPLDSVNSGLRGAAICLILFFACFSYSHFENWWYSRKPGALIYPDRLLLNGDGGPVSYEWSAFGEVFISSLRGKTILQHLHISDLDLKGFARFYAYSLTPIDHLAICPKEFLRLLKAQPDFPDKRPVIDTHHD